MLGRDVEAKFGAAGDLAQAAHAEHLGSVALPRNLVGLDIRLSIAEALARELSGERFAPPALLRRLVAEGKTGKKSGQGFYRWEGETAVSAAFSAAQRRR